MNCLKPTGASPPAAAETTGGQQDERTARHATASNLGSKQRKWGRSSCFPGADQHDSGAIPRCLQENLPSPSINIDDSWVPVNNYIEEDLGFNTEREQAYYDEWDEAALRGIIQRQRKITETSKKLETKKLYQVLIILDDYADSL